MQGVLALTQPKARMSTSTYDSPRQNRERSHPQYMLSLADFVSQMSFQSAYSTVTAFIAAALSWLTTQAHHLRDAALWMSHLPSELSEIIVAAWHVTLHWLSMVFFAVAKCLLIAAVAFGSCVALVILITMLCTIYWALRRSRQCSQNYNCTPTIRSHSHQHQRIFLPEGWHHYGATDCPHFKPPATVEHQIARSFSWYREWSRTSVRYFPTSLGGQGREVITTRYSEERALLV